MRRTLLRVLPALLPALLLVSACDNTTPSEIVWERDLLFVPSWYASPSAVLPAGDGYLFVTTWSDTVGYAPPRLLVERLDSSGDTLWTRQYAPPDTSSYLASWGVTALPASSSGWLLVGACVTSAAIQYNSAYLVRTDSSGDTLWTRLITDSTCTSGPAACAAADGGCWVAMWRYWDTLAVVRVSLVDSTGNRVSTRDYWPRIGFAEAYICPAPDGGFFLAEAGTPQYPNDWARLRLLRADRNGDTLWTCVSDTLHDSWHGIAPTADGGCIAIGTHVISRLTGNQAEACLTKINSGGGFDWERRAGYEWSRQPMTVQQLDDGGYLYAGRSSVNNSTAFICRTDGQGSEVWFSSFGDPSAEAGCVVPTGDGDYVVSGLRTDLATYRSRLFVAQVRPAGN